MRDGFVALDKEWRCSFVSRRAAEILGRTAESLIGKPIWTEVPEAVGRGLHQAYQRAIAEQTLVQWEGSLGSERGSIEVRIHPMSDGLLLCFQDRTDRKEG